MILKKCFGVPDLKNLKKNMENIPKQTSALLMPAHS